MTLAADDLAQLEVEPIDINPKGHLQELLQAISPRSPVYELLAESGPEHEKTFIVRVVWEGMALGEGTGRSKKQAETAAALAGDAKEVLAENGDARVRPGQPGRERGKRLARTGRSVPRIDRGRVIQCVQGRAVAGRPAEMLRDRRGDELLGVTDRCVQRATESQLARDGRRVGATGPVSVDSAREGRREFGHVAAVAEQINRLARRRDVRL